MWKIRCALSHTDLINMISPNLEKRNALCHHPRHSLQPVPSGLASMPPDLPRSASTSSV